MKLVQVAHKMLKLIQSISLPDILLTAVSFILVGIISGCVPAPASQVRAESDFTKWESVKSPLEISSCLSLAWEPLLIPNFVSVKPLVKGYRIDKTSDMGHLYLSADVITTGNTSSVRFWIIEQNVWGENNKEKAKNALISCL